MPLVGTGAFAPLDGLFAYSIQGLMHAQNLDDQTYDFANKQIIVNRGNAQLKTNATNPNPGRPRPASDSGPFPELPILPAFYSLNYPSATPPPFPPRSDSDLIEGSPAYTPNAGYYPWTETGFMVFTPTESIGGPVLDGSVEGRARVNTAGFGGTGAGQPTSGHYQFDQLAGFGNASFPTGIITIQFDNFLAAVWDYSFVQISRDEYILTASSRVPRPGVASGTMKRIVTRQG